MAENTTSTADERTRIDRRQAMKVALGGATAAAVLAAPRIEGFGIAPDYAAAATPNCSDSSPSATRTKPSVTCGAFRCWGTGGFLCLSCASAPIGSAITVTPPPETPPYTTPSVSGTVSGQLVGGGSYSLTLSGFTAGQPWDRCVASVTGSCTSGTFTATPSTREFTGNGTQTGTLICAGGSGFPSGSVSVTMTCYCT